MTQSPEALKPSPEQIKTAGDINTEIVGLLQAPVFDLEGYVLQTERFAGAGLMQFPDLTERFRSEAGKKKPLTAVLDGIVAGYRDGNGPKVHRFAQAARILEIHKDPGFYQWLDKVEQKFPVEAAEPAKDRPGQTQFLYEAINPELTKAGPIDLSKLPIQPSPPLPPAPKPAEEGKPDWARENTPVTITKISETENADYTHRVYAAHITTPGHPEGFDVAIKRAGAGKTLLTEKAQQDLLRNREAAIAEEGRQINQLRAQYAELFPGSPDPFPNCRLSTYREDGQEKNQLIMDLLEGSYWLPIIGPGCPPGQMLSALVQYLQVCATAHSLGISVGAKKHSNVYYYPVEDRLMVTNWDYLNKADDLAIRSDLAQAMNFFVDEFVLRWPDEIKTQLQSLQTQVKDYTKPVSATSASGLIEQVKAIRQTPEPALPASVLTPMPEVDEYTKRTIIQWSNALSQRWLPRFREQQKSLGSKLSVDAIKKCQEESGYITNASGMARCIMFAGVAPHNEIFQELEKICANDYLRQVVFNIEKMIKVNEVTDKKLNPYEERKFPQAYVAWITSQWQPFLDRIHRLEEEGVANPVATVLSQYNENRKTSIELAKLEPVKAPTTPAVPKTTIATLVERGDVKLKELVERIRQIDPYDPQVVEYDAAVAALSKKTTRPISHTS